LGDSKDRSFTKSFWIANCFSGAAEGSVEAIRVPNRIEV